MTFIQKVAAYIHEQEIPLENLTIVLPSERAKKYLASALFTEYQRPILAPEMITMDRWIKGYSPQTVIDKTRALIKLFEIQLRTAKTEEDRSFDEFLSRGTLLLSDFDEIDRYLVDPKQIFRNLASIKEIEQWSFGEEELTPTQQRFMEFWDRLPAYYYALNEELEANNNCYAGRSFRYLTENIDVLFADNKQRTFLFAGFNALSAAERSLMRQLEKMGRAHILINADDYYLSDKQHEAGRFMRDLSAALDGKRLNFVEDNLRTKSLNATLIECAQNTGQVKTAATILAQSTLKEIDETLLLLADESLIGAILKNLPKSIVKANITLGLPIRNTAIRTWAELLFSIQENKVRFRTKAIYFNDLQNFWNHPLVLASIDEEEKKTLIQAEADLVRQNRIFLNVEHLNLGPKVMQLLQLVTVDWQGDWKVAMQHVRNLNRLLFKNLEEGFAFEKAIIECFDRSLVDFENIVQEGLPEMSMKSFKQLFNQHWGMKSIAYHGNPMDGLQIMGLLETRGLDFKRIICVGMNEGQLPPTNPLQTIIPMDLRRVFDLPTPREKQGLFAHHFYRLLHSCEELVVTYNSADESIGSNEPSRYLLQLEMELSRINPNIRIEKRIYSLEEERSESTREIAKTPEIVQRMEELLEKSASASMLKKYLTCPLDFYFRYVMEFGEASVVEEEIEHSTFGTFIHDTLEELYTPFAQYDKEGNKKSPAPPAITSFDIEQMLKQYKLVMRKQFMLKFNQDEEAFTKGKNLLSYQMAQELTERFLKSEVKFLAEQTQPVFIESLEQEYEALVPIEVSGTTKQVRFRGYIDRIDRVGDKVRIIDYKSGKVADTDVSLPKKREDKQQVADAFGKVKHLLQLVQYAYLYHHRHGVVPESSIISFISGNNQPFTLNTQQYEMSELIEWFPECVGMLLEDMFDTSVPFEHTQRHMSFCQYCD